MPFIVGTDGTVAIDRVVGLDDWEVIIEREVQSPNFERALAFVAARYPFMLTRPLTHIRLVSKDMEGAEGLYLHQWDNKYSVIDVQHGGDIANYIDTLVHELTHLRQHKEGRINGMSRMEREAEAQEAAKMAIKEYNG